MYKNKFYLTYGSDINFKFVCIFILHSSPWACDIGLGVLQRGNIGIPFLFSWNVTMTGRD